MADPGHSTPILRRGAERAAAIAEPIWRRSTILRACCGRKPCSRALAKNRVIWPIYPCTTRRDGRKVPPSSRDGVRHAAAPAPRDGCISGSRRRLSADTSSDPQSRITMPTPPPRLQTRRRHILSRVRGRLGRALRRAASGCAMHLYLPIAEISVDSLLLLGIGAAIGFLSGLFGVGGGFLMTPLLIFIGVPPAVAVGYRRDTRSSAPRSRACIAHWRRGNVDLRWAACCWPAAWSARRLGVWLFARAAPAGPDRAASRSPT